MRGNLSGVVASGAPDGFARRLIEHDYDLDKAFRAHAPFSVDTQKLIDTTVVQEWQNRLQIVRRLVENGQVFRLTRPFAHSEIEHHTESGTSAVRRSRNPAARAEQDNVQRSPVKTPIYYTFADFSMSLPDLETSRNQDIPLDTTLLRKKARDIAEDIESAVLNGTNLPQVGSNAALGLLNAPGANTASLNNGAWDGATKTVAQVLDDVKDMIVQLDTIRAFGPVDLFIPVAWMTAIKFLTNTNTDRTAIELIRQSLAGTRRDLFIDESDLLTNKAVMYVRDSMAIDVVLGDFGAPGAPDDPSAPDSNPVPITVIPWEGMGGLELNWKLIACVVPRPKQTFSGKSGIVVLS